MSKSKNNNTCLVSNQVVNVDQGLKFVLTPEKKICFDIDWKLPGNALYLYPSIEKLKIALEKNFFKEKLGVEVKFHDLYDQIVSSFKSKIITFIALAKKSGKLIVGKNNIVESFKGNISEEYVLIQANDASEREKFSNRNQFIVDFYSHSELSASIGKENSNYILALGSLATKIKSLSITYKNFTEGL